MANLNSRILNNLLLFFISGRYNLKPVLVDNNILDDIRTEELELIFGYQRNYTQLTINDIEKLTEHGQPLQDLKDARKKLKNSEMSRTQRIKRLGQGFSIPAFVPLLKPLTHMFK